MKIIMKEEIGVTYEMTLSVLGSRAKMHIFLISGGWKQRIAMEIGMKEEMSVADKIVFSDVFNFFGRLKVAITK